MNFNFTVLLLSIREGPVLNSQLAICSQPSAGKEGSAAMVGGEGHEENRQSQLLLCKVHQVHAGRRLVILENKMGGGRMTILVKRDRTNAPGN